MSGLRAMFFQDYTRLSLVLNTNQIKGLTFDTEILGGFGTANLTLPKTSFDISTWKERLLGTYMVISTTYGDEIYEGSVEGVDDSDEGMTVDMAGLYTKASKKTVYLAYPNLPINLHSVIRDLSTLIQEWQYTLVDTVSGLYQSDTPIEFLYDTKVQETIEKIMKDNVSGLKQVSFAVYNGRPYLFNVLYPWYTVSRRDISVEYGSALSLSGTYNKIQVLYEVNGEKRFTDWYEDIRSQQRYGVREGTVSAGQVPLGVAQTAGELAISRFGKPDETRRLTIKGRLFDYTTKRVVEPYWLRAGQLLFFSDMQANPESRHAYEYDRFQAGYLVTRTTYSHDEASLSVDIGDGMKTFEQYMTDMGISGGVVK